MWLKIILAVFGTIALFFTYSRSAYIGLVISLLTLYYLLKLNKRRRKQFLIICGGVVVGVGLLAFAFRYNSIAQNVLFHTSNSSKSSTSSNAVRFSDLRGGLKDVAREPLGEGPGTAGPASVHNSHPARIAEDYYVQVAQESGWIGLVLFMSINVIVFIRLWRKQADPLASLLLATLIGISLVNLVSHEWADDTLSLIWWGMAGIMLTPDILKHNKSK
jgi:putative inorganic carbon (HCO3(-)) transporter